MFQENLYNILVIQIPCSINRGICSAIHDARLPIDVDKFGFLGEEQIYDPRISYLDSTFENILHKSLSRIGWGLRDQLEELHV